MLGIWEILKLDQKLGAVTVLGFSPPSPNQMNAELNVYFRLPATIYMIY